MTTVGKILSRSLLAGTLLALYAPKPVLADSVLSAASSFNVFTFSDFTGYGTDSIGKMAIGGNFNPAGSGSFTIASGHSGDSSSVYDLVVAGNFTNNNASLGGGKAFVGGNMTWNNPTLPNGAVVDGNFTNNSNGGSTGGTIYYGGTFTSGTALASSKLASPVANPIDFASAKTSLTQFSTYLDNVVANGSVVKAYNNYSLTGSSSTLNVFDMTDTTFNGSTITINAPSSSTVVVNFSGSTDSLTYGSINFTGGITRDHVIFNFPTATTLNLNGISIEGSILAPLATFNGTYGQINGQVIANVITGTTEFHDVLFTGNVVVTSSSSTPEPSTLLSLAGGMAAITFFARRRNQKQSAQ